MIKTFTLIISLILSIFTTVLHAQNSGLVSSKSKPTLDSLETLDAAAKSEYEGRTTHPKLVKRNFAEDESLMSSLSSFKKVVIQYNARNMVFNALFVKTIAEHPEVKYFFFTNEQGILWVNPEMDTDKLLFHLNKISMSPVSIKQDENTEK
jgi:hypothetical protein